MAQIGKGLHNSSRTGPLRPGLRGARNWATAQVRAASYSRQGFWRLVLCIVFLVFFTVLTGLWLGGFLPDARKMGQNFSRSSLQSLGFVVKRIDVVGEGRLREEDVRKALGVKPGDYFFGVDMKEAQARIETLSWVDTVVVRRLWPDRIVVQIMERRPFALWQKDGVIKLVDHEGTVISDADPMQFAGLPLVIGDNAAAEMSDLLVDLGNFPIIASRVDAMSLLPSGRWNIRIGDSEMWIKLPQTDRSSALKTIADLQNSKRILDRDIAVIDVRLSDRISFLPAQTEPA